MKLYIAEFEDDNFEIIYADNDCDALHEAFELEEQGHLLFNLYECDEDYNKIRFVW